MDTFFRIIASLGGLGGIAGIVSLIMQLKKCGKRLKIKGFIPPFNSSNYIIRINNPREHDIEILSISFGKGNPLFSDIHSFYYVSNSNYDDIVNPNTGNLRIPKGSKKEIVVSLKCIVCKYSEIGEAFGKPFDKVYAHIIDENNRSYFLNMGQNIDGLRLLANNDKSECERR